jgi:uncharacterized membrane protein
MRSDSQNKKFNIKKFINTPTQPIKITYQKLFWLIIGGSLLGVLLEGIWCAVTPGRSWETHVITIWGPFCLIYGMGAAAFYVIAAKLQKYNMIVKFLACAAVGDIVELFCGMLLKYGMHMRAWDYTNQFMNFQGMISLVMTFMWGLLGTLYIYLAIPHLEKLFAKMHGNGWKTACIVFSAFMAVNLICTFACMERWAMRHRNIEPANKLTEFIDLIYDDDKMANRFIEWEFIETDIDLSH